MIIIKARKLYIDNYNDININNSNNFDTNEITAKKAASLSDHVDLPSVSQEPLHQTEWDACRCVQYIVAGSIGVQDNVNGDRLTVSRFLSSHS